MRCGPPHNWPWADNVPVVDIHNVSQTFGHGDLAVQALKPTSLAVEAGELVALLGPSGSGKSTLLLAISLIQPPTTGRIVIDGQTLFDEGPTGIDPPRGRAADAGRPPRANRRRDARLSSGPASVVPDGSLGSRQHARLALAGSASPSAAATQSFAAALPAASSTGSQTGENGGA